MAPAGFSIRDLNGMEDMRECEAIEREVWGFVDLDIVPAGLLAVMGHYGAASAGAFVEDRMAGFVVSFPGFVDGKPLHHSHMLAVRPEFRGRNIGIALKWTQADRVLAQGLDHVNWTFDPLQARNANLNLNRLGAVASIYRENVYGESQSPLHGGIPTDRLEPDWFLKSDRVARARRGELKPPPGVPELPHVHALLPRRGDYPECGPMGEIPDAPEVLLGIPTDFTAMIRDDAGLAHDWRLKTRHAFQRLLASGYEARGFHEGGGEAAYRLVRRA